jgi:hypothetical protein
MKPVGLEAYLFDRATVCARSQHQHQHQQEGCVRWSHFRGEEVALLGRALGGERLAGILRAMAKAPESFFRGAPDCVFFRNDFSAESSSDSSNNAGDDDAGGGEMSLARQRRELYHCGAAPWVYDDVFVVEVKSEGDKLSPNQDVWFQLLLACRVPVDKCDISEDKQLVARKK